MEFSSSFWIFSFQGFSAPHIIDLIIGHISADETDPRTGGINADEHLPIRICSLQVKVIMGGFVEQVGW
jgi:hypothetical protein